MPNIIHDFLWCWNHMSIFFYFFNILQCTCFLLMSLYKKQLYLRLENKGALGPTLVNFF